MISFNKPIVLEKGIKYVRQAIEKGHLRGDHEFCKMCSNWLETNLPARKVLLTPSCTHALEMAAILIGIKPGDEVIMPSFTFSSTANAFALQGARLVFIDIRPDTMNMDEKLLEDAITPRSKAIVPVHYAGISCAMDEIMSIAKKHGLYVIEDAAQGMMGKYKGRALGTIGDIGCYSFHETKNYNMGEGGAIIINRPELVERAEIIREKGTNRERFLRGQVDKYSWVDIGSSYLPSELAAAYLYAQLEIAEEINNNRLQSYQMYQEMLSCLEQEKLIELPDIPKECQGNGHIFYIKVKDIQARTDIITHLKQEGVTALFHYVPLHLSQAGKKYGIFSGEDRITTTDSERLLRLPMYYQLEQNDIFHIVKSIQKWREYCCLEG